MKRVYYLFLIILLPLTVKAQQEISVTPISELPAVARKVHEIVPFTDEAGRACLYLIGENRVANLNTVHLIALSSEGEFVSKTRKPLELPKSDELLGAISTPEHFDIYSYRKSGKQLVLVNYSVEKNTGNITSKPDIILDINDNAKQITSFVDKDQIILLYYINKTNHIQVVQIDANGQQHSSMIPVEVDLANERFVRNSEFVFMDAYSDKTIFSNHHQKKVYKQGNKLYFIFDAFYKRQRPATTTDIIELDLETKTSQLSQLPFPPATFSKNFNSYLYKDKIFRLQLGKSDFVLDVYDLNTRKELANYTYDKKDQLTLKSTRFITHSGNTVHRKYEKGPVETKQVLLTLGGGTPSIIVEEASENMLQVTIGSYFQPQSGGAMVPMGGGSFSTPGGMAAAPTLWMRAGGNYSNGGGVSTSFKTFLNTESLEKVTYTDPRPDLTPIEEFVKALLVSKTDIGTQVTFKVKGVDYFMYEDKKAKALKLVSFADPAQQ